MQTCVKCQCKATTSRDGEPVCWIHADEGLDDVTICPECETLRTDIDLADLEDEWPDECGC